MMVMSVTAGENINLIGLRRKLRRNPTLEEVEEAPCGGGQVVKRAVGSW